jgi:hypothetical protein
MIFTKKVFILILLAWLLFAGFGLYNLFIRPVLPYSIQEVKEGILLIEPLGTTETKTIVSPLVLTIDSVSVSKKFVVATIVENKRIGESVTIALPLHK